MNSRVSILLLIFILSCQVNFAQTDAYTGTWRIEKNEYYPSIQMELQVGHPERNLLYPARIFLQCDSFNAVYELLLVRKNLRQLGISRNKFPRKEAPFSLGNATIVLNGTLDYTRDGKGEPLLTVNRLIAQKYGIDLTAINSIEPTHQSTATALMKFLKEADISFRKVNAEAWQDEDADKITQPRFSPEYFGIMDTLHVQTRDGRLVFTGNKKSGNDHASVMLNGKSIIDDIELGKRKEPEEVLLDTGLNILTFFAENFPKSAPNNGQVTLELGNRKIKTDFNNKADIAAGFIVAKIYYDKDKDADTKFETSTIPFFSEHFLQRNEKVIGNIVSRSATVTLALWDDAVEDGDSISLRINGKWVAQGFPVKKNPQFLQVTLNPGPNTITFVADNLGSIPPNTSVLEIIDGKKRKSFNIETNLDQNNLVNIFYEVKQD